MGQHRRGRLVSSKSWKALVTSGVARPSCAISLRQTSGVQSGFSRICRLFKAGSIYSGPALRDFLTNLSTKAHFQNRVRAFHRMLRSGERTQRSISSPPLPSRRAQSSGKFVWPTSSLSVFLPLGMGVLSRLSAVTTHYLSLRVLTPGQYFIFIGRMVHCRELCSATLGALDKLMASSQTQQQQLFFRSLRCRGGQFSCRLLG